MKKNGFILILLILCLMLASCGYVSNKVDTDIEGLDFEACLSELEDRISSEYQLKDFKLIRLITSVQKGKRAGHSLTVFGRYDNNGESALWDKSFDISKKDHFSFINANDNFIIYNTEWDSSYSILVLNPPAWAINSVYKIMFGRSIPPQSTVKNDSSAETTPTEATAPDPRGIYLSLESVSDSYVTVIWHNNTDHEIFFGEYYTIETYKNGQWEEIPHSPIAYPSVAIGLLPHSQIPKSYSLSPFELTEGEDYRVRSYFSPHTGGSYDIYQPFEWPAQN